MPIFGTPHVSAVNGKFILNLRKYGKWNENGSSVPQRVSVKQPQDGGEVDEFKRSHSGNVENCDLHTPARCLLFSISGFRNPHKPSH